MCRFHRTGFSLTVPIYFPQGAGSLCWKPWGVTTPRTRVGPTQVGVSRHSNRGAKGLIPAARRVSCANYSLGADLQSR